VAALQVGSPAPDAALLGEGDRAVRLSELWSRQPVVLVFLRHFG
jgi:peroxiredoxin